MRTQLTNDMHPKSILLLGLIFAFLNLSAQSWHLHLNGNETYFLNNDLKGQYPILWYSSNDDRGVLVGGFGVGVSHRRPWQNKSYWKFQLNVQRSRFYDQPSIIYDFNGQPLSANIGVNTNVNTSLLAMPTWRIGQTERFHFGVGLGIRTTVWSRSDYGIFEVNGEKTDLKFKNKSISPIIVLFPVEWSYQVGRFTFATRGELGLTPASRLSAYSQERHFWVFGEVGYRLKG